MTFDRVLASLVSVCVVVTACNRDRKPVGADSAAAVTPPAVQPASPGVNTGWNTEEAGPVMLLTGQENTPNAAIVLPWLTDSTLASARAFVLDSLSNMPVDLFNRTGSTGSSALMVRSQAPSTEGCLSWPTGMLSPPPREWRFGLRKGVATALPLDSLEGMTASDSSQVTVEIARIASAVAEGSDPAFRGLPFAVRRAYRFSLGTNSILVGDVVRKIAEEANPREERLLLIAERASESDGKYAVAFKSRVAGSEEDVRTNEVLGAVRFTRGNPAIVVRFEYDEGGNSALIERTGQRQWRITWRSAYTGC